MSVLERRRLPGRSLLVWIRSTQTFPRERPHRKDLASGARRPPAFPRKRHCGGEGSAKPLCQSGEALAKSNAARGLDIDAQTARCGWMGERMDYNTAIDGLCWQAGYR